LTSHYFGDRQVVPTSGSAHNFDQPTDYFQISKSNMSSPADKILNIQRDLLRIQSRVLRVMADVDTLATELNPDPVPPGSCRRFDGDILLYGQRRAARRLLVHAVNAGALLPRDALGFTIEAESSDDEDRDFLTWRCQAVAATPTSNATGATPTLVSTTTSGNRGTARRVATRNAVEATRAAGFDLPRRSPRKKPALKLTPALLAAKAQAKAWSETRTAKK
jgi:hypothetical protein